MGAPGNGGVFAFGARAGHARGRLCPGMGGGGIRGGAGRRAWWPRRGSVRPRGTGGGTPRAWGAGRGCWGMRAGAHGGVLACGRWPECGGGGLVVRAEGMGGGRSPACHRAIISSRRPRIRTSIATMRSWTASGSQAGAMVASTERRNSAHPVARRVGWDDMNNRYSNSPPMARGGRIFFLGLGWWGLPLTQPSPPRGEGLCFTNQRGGSWTGRKVIESLFASFSSEKEDSC